MLTASQIQSIFKAEGISVYETYFSFDREVDVVLKSNEIQDFLHLVQENDIKSVFYAFGYVNPEDYLITDDDIPDFDAYTNGRELVYNAFIKEFRAEQYKFNSQISPFLSDKPKALCVYCLLSGVQIGILLENPWHLSLPDKSAVLLGLDHLLDNMYTDALDKAYSKEEAKRNAILDKIIAYLDTTDEWHTCTNQRLRRNYCYDLATKYEKEYGLRADPFRIIDALEIRWNQYKSNKNK